MPITVPPVSFPAVNTENPSTTNYLNPGFKLPQLPRAPGTIEGCAWYANYQENTTDATFNSCSFISYGYCVEFSDLISWNPSLSKNKTECALQPGFSYCVQKTDTTAYVPSDNHCVSVDATIIHDGTASDCVCFTRVSGYDGTVGVDCASVAEDASIKLSQLTSWNSWLGANCDEALFANLEENDFRAVCIGVNSTAPTATATSPPLTSTGTKSSASMGPTPTGIVPGCRQFYTVQSGDSCAAIQGMFAISFGDFFKWNPSILSWGFTDVRVPSYAYCVSAPTSSSTGGGGPAAPTQSGAAPNCNKYYTVQSGDSCEKIEGQFGITLPQLYRWNPAIGPD
ncbi:LysM domain protein, partial [Apiospora aurea]